MKTLILSLAVLVLSGCAVDPNGTSAFSVKGNGYTTHTVHHQGIDDVTTNLNELNMVVSLPKQGTSVNVENNHVIIK